MSIADSSTPSCHYWTVPLEPPEGASPRLTDYVIKSKTALQKMVDLLGTAELAAPMQIPKQPPSDLARERESRNSYSARMAGSTIERRMLNGESTVQQVTHADVGRVADIKATVLQAIQKRIIDLSSVLQAIDDSLMVQGSFPVSGPTTGPTLSPDTEKALAIEIVRTLIYVQNWLAHALKATGVTSVDDFPLFQFPDQKLVPRDPLLGTSGPGPDLPGVR
ncbi:hypothetical protein ABTW96_24345 [Nocardia beijingensis]|uniref:hypothetical protein n=1 Tax=Nocardia beijingensis TaxID=95162 RepID=UPI003331F0A1